MIDPLKITIYDTSIDRTEEYDKRWLTTDLYSRFLQNADVGGSDLIGLNDCFGYRSGVVGILLIALIYVFDRLPFFSHVSKYVFILLMLEGRYLGIWRHDPKKQIANNAQVRANFKVISPEYRYPRRSLEDSGILILARAGSQISILKSEYVAFRRNDDSECGFIGIVMERDGENLLWIHARLASRPALEPIAFLKGCFTASSREKYITSVLESEIGEIVDFARRYPDRKIIMSGDLNMGNLQNPILQELIQHMDLRPGRDLITDILDNTTFFPTPVQETQTYLLISKGLDYRTYKTLPEASFDKSESLVLYTELVSVNA